MGKPLRVLMVEDVEQDAALALRELRRGGFDVAFQRVETAEAMSAALSAETWDAVISDYTMPRFSALLALRLMKERDLDLPFIIVSGTIGEEVAVEALRAGAHDFMAKGKFARLVPAMVRELREAETRRERRLMEADLLASEQRFHELFELGPDAIVMTNAEAVITLLNQPAAALFGYSREELIGQSVEMLVPAGSRHDHGGLREACLRAAVPRAAGAGMLNLQGLKSDGSLFPVEIRLAPIQLKTGPQVAAAVRDVTARAQLEAQLRQSQKMEAIGRLAGGVAHDFNNILTVIESYAWLLEDSLGAADARYADVVEIRRAAERASGITGQLLALSRHSIGAPRSIDLGEVVAGFVPMLKRLIGERVVLVVHRSEVPAVVADPGHIEQVLMNIAVNARDAMPGGGRLTIETEVVDVDEESPAANGLQPGRYVVVAITDTGTGIDADTQRQMFDPFFTTKEAGKGTGLGLAIAHGIVSQAGGAITVYSEIGHGTTFRVKLPAADVVVAAPTREASAAPAVLPAVTVLVVDDDREVRAVAARILRESGCQVIEAATAEEARGVCTTHDGVIDVIVLDIVLADGRGDLLVHELRELRPALNIVLMSGYPAGALSPAGAPPRDLLAKPFSPSELRAAVARCLGAPGSGSGKESTPAPRGPSAPAARSRVLLAEDDLGFRRIVARVLSGSGLEVVEVDGGRLALAALKTSRFDVILSDIHMPDGGGLDLLRAVRRIDLDVPIILMTGLPDAESAASAVENGAFRYLGKPLDTDALVKLVHHAARAHALARVRREAFSVTGANVGVVDRAGLEFRFDHAMDGLWLAFQPIVEARSGTQFGVEALLRSDEASLRGSAAMLDAATQLGRLTQLGRRVRGLAAAALAPRADAGKLFVNLHPQDLTDPELVDEDAPLTKIASRVILEITERASFVSSPELVARLARLRELGFRLAVDDIGAGYSGVASFTELMPEVVKIDIALVRGVHQSAAKQRTIAELCKLCHEGGCLVVAEGIESINERECVVSLGCDLLQGYLLGRPARQLPR